MKDKALNEKLQATILKFPGKGILEISIEEENIFNSIINNNKYHKIYIIKLMYKKKLYLFSYNSAKSTIKNHFIQTFFEYFSIIFPYLLYFFYYMKIKMWTFTKSNGIAIRIDHRINKQRLCRRLHVKFFINFVYFC